MLCDICTVEDSSFYKNTTLAIMPIFVSEALLHENKNSCNNHFTEWFSSILNVVEVLGIIFFSCPLSLV